MVENALPEIVSKFEKLVCKIKTISSSFSEKNPFRQCQSSIFTFITRTYVNLIRNQVQVNYYFNPYILKREQVCKFIECMLGLPDIVKDWPGIRVEIESIIYQYLVNESNNRFRVKDLLKKIYAEKCDASGLCELKTLYLESMITFCIDYNLWMECLLEDYDIKKNSCLNVFMKDLKEQSFKEKLDMIPTDFSKFQVKKKKNIKKPRKERVKNEYQRILELLKSNLQNRNSTLISGELVLNLILFIASKFKQVRQSILFEFKVGNDQFLKYILIKWLPKQVYRLNSQNVHISHVKVKDGRLPQLQLFNQLIEILVDDTNYKHFNSSYIKKTFAILYQSISTCTDTNMILRLSKALALTSLALLNKLNIEAKILTIDKPMLNMIKQTFYTQISLNEEDMHMQRSNSLVDIDANQKHLAMSNTTPHLHGHASSLIKDASLPNLSVQYNLEKELSNKDYKDNGKDIDVKKWSKAELSDCQSIQNLMLKLPNQILKQNHLDKHKMQVEDVSLTLISTVEALTNVLNNILFKEYINAQQSKGDKDKDKDTIPEEQKLPDTISNQDSNSDDGETEEEESDDDMVDTDEQVDPDEQEAEDTHYQMDPEGYLDGNYYQNADEGQGDANEDEEEDDDDDGEDDSVSQDGEDNDNAEDNDMEDEGGQDGNGDDEGEEEDDDEDDEGHDEHASNDFAVEIDHLDNYEQVEAGEDILDPREEAVDFNQFVQPHGSLRNNIFESLSQIQNNSNFDILFRNGRNMFLRNFKVKKLLNQFQFDQSEMNLLMNSNLTGSHNEKHFSMTEDESDSVNFQFFRPNNFDSPEDYSGETTRLAKTIQQANKDSLQGILQFYVDKVEDFMDKIESKYKIDLFTNLLTTEDNELIQTRKEFHSKNAKSSVELQEIKNLIDQKEKSEHNIIQYSNLDNYKNIVIDERNIPPLDQRTINAINNQFASNITHTESNQNLIKTIPEENVGEKITDTEVNNEESTIHKAKQTDHIQAINQIRPQLTASKLQAYNESLWKTLNSDMYQTNFQILVYNQLKFNQQLFTNDFEFHEQDKTIIKKEVDHDLKIIQENSNPVHKISNDEMNDDQNGNYGDNVNENDNHVGMAQSVAIANILHPVHPNLNANEDNIQQPQSIHSNDALQEAHSERTDEISNMITNMMGEIQMYRNSIRNIVNSNTNALNLDQGALGNTGVHPNPLGLNNANGFNGLIQTIPDDGDHHVQLNTGSVAGVDNLNQNLEQNNGGASEENMDCPQELMNEDGTISIPREEMEALQEQQRIRNGEVQNNNAPQALINTNINADANPQANLNNNNNITDLTHPLLVSDETLAKINLDKEFLSALPTELVIETIVNQLSMYSADDFTQMNITRNDIPPIVLSKIPYIQFNEGAAAGDNFDIFNEQHLMNLPEDLRNDILAQRTVLQQYSSNGNQVHENQIFVESMSVAAQNEYLRGCTSVVLQTLSAEMQNRARELRRNGDLQPRVLAPNKQKLKPKHDIYATKITAEDELRKCYLEHDPTAISAAVDLVFAHSRYINLFKEKRELISSFIGKFALNPSNRDYLITCMTHLLLSNMNGLEGKQLTSDTYYKCFSNSIFLIKIISTYVDEFPRVFRYMTIQKNNKNLLCDYINLLSHSAVLQSKNHFSEIIKLIFKFNKKLLLQFEVKEEQRDRRKTAVNIKNKHCALVDSKTAQAICECLSLAAQETEIKTLLEFIKTLSLNEENRAEFKKIISVKLEPLASLVLQFINQLNNMVQFEANSSEIFRTHYEFNNKEQCNPILLLKRLITLFKFFDADFNIEDYPLLTKIWEVLKNLLSKISVKFGQSLETNKNLSNDGSKMTILNIVTPLLEVQFQLFGSGTLEQNDSYALKFTMTEHEEEDSQTNFFKFCDSNKKLINIIIRQRPTVLNEGFNIFVDKWFNLLEFDNKRTQFRQEIRKLKHTGTKTLYITVDRQNVFNDSFQQLRFKKESEMRDKLSVKFDKEEGEDIGGVTREWFQILSREMFNQNYALYKTSATGYTQQPNENSWINPEHTSYFDFIGRIISKALHDGCLMDVYFTKAFYKQMLQQTVCLQDFEDVDKEYYNTLKWILENSIEGVVDMTFSVEIDQFGRPQVYDLVPNGRNIPVTDLNKADYVQKICEYKLCKSIEGQIKAFLKGFNLLIPHKLLKIFDFRELEQMISGLPDFDLEDLKANVEYHGQSECSPQIRWLWATLNEFSQEERAAFLQFVTGSSKIPLDGFKALLGHKGVQKMSIYKCYKNNNSLPTSHTCFNQLDLPEYGSQSQLKEKIKCAIQQGKEGFGIL